jgi:hypothetical protein
MLKRSVPMITTLPDVDGMAVGLGGRKVNTEPWVVKVMGESAAGSVMMAAPAVTTHGADAAWFGPGIGLLLAGALGSLDCDVASVALPAELAAGEFDAPAPPLPGMMGAELWLLLPTIPEEPGDAGLRIGDETPAALQQVVAVRVK